MTSPGDIAFGTVMNSNLWDDRMSRRQVNPVDIYVRDGAVDGIKVADEYQNRLIPKDTELGDIFKPASDVQVLCLDIFPGSDDIKVYEGVMQEVYNGEAFIDSIDKHPTDKGFVVMLVVNRARMVFRKDSYNELFPPMENK